MSFGRTGKILSGKSNINKIPRNLIRFVTKWKAEHLDTRENIDQKRKQNLQITKNSINTQKKKKQKFYLNLNYCLKKKRSQRISLRPMLVRLIPKSPMKSPFLRLISKSAFLRLIPRSPFLWFIPMWPMKSPFLRLIPN